MRLTMDTMVGYAVEALEACGFNGPVELGCLRWARLPGSTWANLGFTTEEIGYDAEVSL